MKAATKAPHIAGLELFDSCVTVGRLVRAGMGVCILPEDVLAIMDRYDIAEALVHDNEARMVRPRSRGNRRILEVAAGSDRLHPVWVLEPPESPDPAAARALVEEMLGEGVKVARLMMGVAPPLGWLWDDLLAALEEHRLPCMLDFAATSPSGPAGSTQGLPDAWAVDALRDLCLAHPGLPMVLSHASGGLGLSHPTLPLLRRVPNLHVDITAVVDYWRKAATELGPHRVFFATGMPFYDPGIFVSNVQYAHEINTEAKRAICGGNLRRLIACVR